MPIHHKILKPRQAEAGRIKIGHLGEKRTKKGGTGEYRLPEKLDHFLLTTNERDEDGNFEIDQKLMDQLEKDPDGKVRRLKILFSSDIIEEIFPTSLACYKGRNLFCKGDGYSPATRYDLRDERRDGQLVTIKTGKTTQVECPCPYLGATGGLQCKPHGTLWATVVVGEHTQIGARHSFRTTSWESIRQILAALKEIRDMIGTLVGPELTMHLRPRVVRPKGSDRAKIVYAVHITCTSKDIQALRERVLAQAQMRHNVAALAGRPIRLGLAAPGVGESAEEQARLQQEYHPEDEGEDDEGIDYDPVTGEVFGSDAIDADVVEQPASAEEESQAPAEESEDPNAPLPEDHRMRIEFARLITEITIDRDFSDADAKKARGEIWTEAVEAAGMPRLPWRELTRARAEKIYPKLRAMLRDPDVGGDAEEWSEGDTP